MPLRKSISPPVDQFGFPTILDQGEDPRAGGVGLISWAGDPGGYNTASGVLTSQRVYVSSLYIPAGQVISNIYLNTQTAGVTGTPTSFTVGIADANGVLLAKSAELKASASLTATGVNPYPCAYTTLQSDAGNGFYYIVVLEDKTADFTTPVQFGKSAGNVNVALTGMPVLYGTGATGSQAALPAVGAAIVGGIVATNGLPLWTAVG